jgi:hypothetical protein
MEKLAMIVPKHRRTRTAARARRKALWHSWRAEALEARCLLSGGTEPQAVAGSGQVVIGDFNGDGIADEAVVGPGTSAAVSIRYGNADGTFQAAKDLLPGSPSDGIAAGDFGNGATDLAVLRKASGANPASLLIFTNQGNFEFTLTDVLTDSNAPTSITAGDITGDGKISLVMTTASGQVEVRLGKGDGTFDDPVLYNTVTQADHVAVGDLGGAPALVVTSQVDSKIELLPRQADGSFAAEIATNLPAAPSAFALGDVNGDGSLDAITANGPSSRTVDVSPYEGFFAFSAPTTYGVAGAPVAVLAADLRGDGNLDLIVATSDGTTGSVSVLLGNGDGTFGPARDYALPGAPLGVGVSPDAKHQGALDILAPTASGAGDHVLFANGDGTFGTLPLTLTQIKGQDIIGVKGLAVPGLQPATFVDTSTSTAAGQFTATIDWGDGTSSAGAITDLGTVYQGTGPRIGEQFGVSGTHEYAADSPHTVVVTIAKSDGETVTTTSHATVLDNPFSVQGQSLKATEGIAVQGKLATFTDVANEPAKDLTATINWGPGIAPTAAAVTVTSDLFGTSYTVDNTGLPSAALPKPGTYTATVTIRGSSGFSASVLDAVTVAEAALKATGGSTVLPAQAWVPLQGVTLATFTDGNPLAKTSDFAATIDWGDGTNSTGTIAATTFPPTTDPNTGATVPGYTLFTVAGDHTYQAMGDHTITVTIVHLTGAAKATATTPVHVVDAVLNGNGLSTVLQAQAWQPLQGETVATFTDGNPQAKPADFSATIDWGDHSTATAGTITATTFPPTTDPNTGATVPGYTLFTVAGDHTYTKPSQDTVHVTIAHLGGTAATSAATRIVVAPAPLNVIGGLAITAVQQATTPALSLATISEQGSHGASEFGASIAWGDGTTTPAAIGSAPTPQVIGPGGIVSSDYTALGSHAYAQPGTYTIQVTVHDAQGLSQTVEDTIVVRPNAIPLTGQLDPARDSGPSSSDGITNVTQPIYLGTTAPGATVTLFVSPYGGAPVPVGRAMADAQGLWSLTTAPLVQGVYGITATAVDTSGTVTKSLALPTLTIDTAAPVITGVSISPPSAQATITFQAGPAGFDPSQLTTESIYALSLINARPGRVYSVTNVTITNGAGPNGAVAVTLSFGGLRRMRSGQYVLSVSPGTVNDRAGNLLAGGFTGTFPTDPNASGSGFAAKFTTNGWSATVLPLVGTNSTHGRRPLVTRHGRRRH